MTLTKEGWEHWSGVDTDLLMKYNRVQKDFTAFIIENSCFEAFRHNLRTAEATEPGKFPGHYTMETVVQDHMVDPEYIIMDAFIWEDTEEGCGFWRDLDIKWEDYVRTQDY